MLEQTRKWDWLKIGLGAFVFLLSFIVYVNTMAPSVSFWDCGEFIATSRTLGVPHPPGSPLYLLIARIFSLLPFTGGGATDPLLNEPQYHFVAFRINMISPLVTALANTFLFLIIVHLVESWRGKSKTLTDKWIAYGGGVIGALALAFSDSHWFNAMEAEVYAMSIFFTAIVVWLILKWEDRLAAGGTGVRDLLLIAYMIGLGTSVHMLNLLTIPFIALIMYMRLNPDEDGTELMLNVLIILGILFFSALIAVKLVLPDTSYEYRILTSAQRGQKLMALMAVLLGFGAAGIFGVAQSFKPERRQRFYRQLLMIIGAGVAFVIINGGVIKGLPQMAEAVASIINTERSVPTISITFVVGIALLVVVAYYSPRWFPQRIGSVVRLATMALLLVVMGYSSYEVLFIRSAQNPNIDENDPETVRQAIAYLEREQYGSYPLFYRDRWEEEPLTLRNAQVGQVVHLQGTNEIGTLAGIVDQKRGLVKVKVGRRELTRNIGYLSVIKKGYTSQWDFFWRYQLNKMYLRYFKWQFWGRIGNRADWRQLWALPFILGLIGMGHHFYKDPKRSFAVLALFVMMGIAIILYLNQDDPQPRERDYSYVGSFFAFAIWIGIGATAVLEKIVETVKRPKPVMAVVTLVLFLAVPVNMLLANYDTHDRSGNYVAWEYSYNLLNTCEPDAILFTNGDNDTFPLWYLQEVEGIRRDVRVVNLSLLNTPWYIKQLKHFAPQVPISMSDEEIDNINIRRWTEREISLPGPTKESPPLKWDLKPTISRQRDPRTGKLVGGLKVQDLMILEILASNHWRKPIYFAVTISPTNKLGLDPYLRMDGQAYRLMDHRVGAEIDPEILSSNIMNKYRYTNLDNPDVYYPPNVKRLLQNYRTGFLQLAYYEGTHGNPQKALEALHFMDEKITDEAVPYTFMDLYLQVAQMYRQFGDETAARRMMEKALSNGRENFPLIEKLKVAATWTDMFDAPDKALEILEPLAKMYRENPQLIYETARAYVKSGRMPAAAEWVDRLAQIAPGAPEVRDLQRRVQQLRQADTLAH